MRSRSTQNTSPGKRFFFAWIFPSIFALIGAAIVIWAIGVLASGHESSGWPGVDGVVTASSVDSRDSSYQGRSSRGSSTRGSSRTYFARVEYEYTVAGEAYTGDRIAFNARHASGNPADARVIQERYPEGATVTVHFDPRDPASSVLEIGIAPAAWGLLVVGAIFLCVGVAGLLFLPRAIERGWVHIR